MNSRERLLTAIFHIEPERLKREFGRNITFWGGGCDTKSLAELTCL